MPNPTPARQVIAERILLVLIPVAVFVLAGQAELNERIAATTLAYEAIQLDELPAALLALTSLLAWISWRNNSRAIRELALRIEAEQALAEKQQELRELARRITDAQEAERRQLAHELHDDLGQTLNAIKIEAVGLRDGATSPPADRHRSAAAIVGLTDQVYASVRRLLGRLRPIALDELGLYAALEHAVTEWQARTPAIHFELRGPAQFPILDETCALALYRICQEGVTNALRHAQPTRVSIEFSLAAGAVLQVSIRDNGKGTNLATACPGFGLLGMRERIEGIGGRIDLRSRPAAGFEIQASIPLPRPEAAAT